MLLRKMTTHLARLEAQFDDCSSRESEGFLTAQRYHELYPNLSHYNGGESDGSSAVAQQFFTPATVTPVVISREISAEWVYADNPSSDTRILYIHGGGWCAGSATVYRQLAAQISNETGYPVLLPRYRPAPKYRYPSALADCLAAYAYALVSGPEGRSLPANVIIIGDSVGGNLAIALSLTLKQRNIHLPSSLILLSPLCDCESDILRSRDDLIAARWLQRCIDNYLDAKTERRIPTISPIRGDLSCLPPLLVQVGEYDPVRDQSIYLVDKARKAGVTANLQIVPGMPHTFQRFSPVVADARRAIEHISSFILSRDTSRNDTSNIIYPKFRQTKN